MRTYRWILLAGLVLMLAGWLAGLLLAGPDGTPPQAARLIGAFGQLAVVVSIAGLLAVFLVRKLMIRRTRPPQQGGGD